VVVDVALPLVFLVGILVLRMVVSDLGMVVLVGVAGGEVSPVLPRPQVMGDVKMRVPVDLFVVVMSLCHSGLLRERSGSA
jgi:hypothetical protein